MPGFGVVRWQFEDGVDTYVFDINPREGGTPEYRKNILTQNTLAPDGRTLIYEGADEPLKLSWSGVILEQSTHETFVDWYSKRHQIEVTNDLEDTYTVYITSYVPKRIRSALHKYKREYTMEATILDWPLA